MSGLQPVPFCKGRSHEPRLSQPYVPGKTHERFWTNAEIAIVRRYYPSGGAASCLAHLQAHRKASGVYALANKLGLSSAVGGKPKTKIDVPADIDDQIRAEWALLDGRKRGGVAELADRLGVPRWWLSDRARRLGLTIAHKKEPPWTEAETALMRLVPLHDPDRCAAIFREHGFNRSPTAIVVRSKRLELSRRATRETLSARGVAKILGVDDKGVTALCISGDLVAEKRADRRLPQQGGSAWEIRPADLRRYCIDHIDRIDLRKVEKFAFVALIAGEGQPKAAPPPAIAPVKQAGAENPRPKKQPRFVWKKSWGN